MFVSIKLDYTAKKNPHIWTLSSLSHIVSIDYFQTLRLGRAQ